MSSNDNLEHFVGETIATAVDCLTGPSPPGHVVARCLGEWLRADAVGYGCFDIAIGSSHLAVWPDTLDRQLLTSTTPGMLHAHPVLHHWLTGHTDVAAVSTVVRDESTWRNSAAYALLRHELGCTESAGIRLDAGSSSLHALLFARRRTFTVEELSVMAALQRPTIALHRHHAWLLAGREPGAADGVPCATFAHCLTPREVQVLQLLADGLLARTIAARLAISPRTVHRHLSHIYAKLDSHDRLTAVAHARALGVLDGRDTRAAG